MGVTILVDVDMVSLCVIVVSVSSGTAAIGLGGSSARYGMSGLIRLMGTTC